MTSASPPVFCRLFDRGLRAIRGIAAGLMALARRLPRTRITMLRLAIANIYRPRRADPVGGDVARPRPRRIGHDYGDRRQSAAAIPGRRCRTTRRHSISSIFPATEADRFGAFPNRLRRNRRSRMCRCCADASPPPAVSRRKTSKPSTTANGLLQSDRGLTYTGEIPKAPR